MTYKEMPEQWKADAARWLDAILELRVRVEALEVANSARFMENLRLTNAVADQVPDRNKFLADTMADEDDTKPTANSSQVGGSLVARVERRIRHAHEVGGFQARAAIREVAAWMTSNPDVYFPPALVFALEQETER
jgi:uncharacterized protein (DUF1501 family)